MMGRAVLVLCWLSGVALACPPRRMASDDAHGAAIALAFMAFCILGYAVARANAVRRTFATSRRLVPADIEVFRRVARIRRVRVAWFAASCAIVLALVTKLTLMAEAMIWVVTPALLLLAVGMIALCRLQVLIGLQAEPGLRIVSHGDYLYAARGTRLVGWVAASPAVLARASALPVAKLR